MATWVSLPLYLSKEGSLNLSGKDYANISIERRETSPIPKSSLNCFYWNFLTTSISLASRCPPSWILDFVLMVSQLYVVLSHASSLFSLIRMPWDLYGMSSPSYFFSSFISIFNLSKSCSCVRDCLQDITLYWQGSHFLLLWWYYCYLLFRLGVKRSEINKPIDGANDPASVLLSSNWFAKYKKYRVVWWIKLPMPKSVWDSR